MHAAVAALPLRFRTEFIQPNVLPAISTCPLPPLQLPLEAREALHSYNTSVERNAASRLFRELAGDFCPPGRCLYLKPTGRVTRGAGWRRTKRRQYHAVFVDGSAVIDEGVLLSGRMMAGEVVGFGDVWHVCDTLRRWARMHL